MTQVPDPSVTSAQIAETGGRTFVVGDIHGSYAEFDCLANYLLGVENFGREDTLIFVGDYIDRGYESQSVVQRILDLRAEFPGRIYTLRGNHEDMLLGYLGLNGSNGENFIINGGTQTLISYGLNESQPQDYLIDSLPEDHLKFFQELLTYVELKNHIVVHAGLNPNYSLSEQVHLDMLWIRDQFIMLPHSFKKTIVFGHTPFKDILVDLPFKIGIDTGLVYGNVLTCIELSRQEIFQIKAGNKKIKKKSY